MTLSDIKTVAIDRLTTRQLPIFVAFAAIIARRIHVKLHYELQFATLFGRFHGGAA